MTDLPTRRLRGTTAALIAIALGTPVSAEVKYRRAGLIHTGFSDKRVATDLWTVKGSSTERNGSVSVALYRAAEIASAANIDTIRIVKQKIKQITTTMHSGYTIIGYNERAEVTFRAVRSDADRTACDMPDATRCLTLPVAGLLARYGPEIDMPAARAGETPAAPVPIALRSQMMDDFAAAASRRGYATPADRYPAWQRPTAVTPVPASPPLPARIPLPPRVAPPRSTPIAPTETTFAQRLADAQPVRGREPTQGWTITD